MRLLGPRQALSASQQLLFLKKAGFEGAEYAIKRDRLTWQGKLRPDALGRDYTVRIEHSAGGYPDVVVEEPDLLILTDGRDPPHVYPDPLRLCLHLPGTGEWEPWMRLDQSIVPWAMLWLYYFEEWLESGDWKGGGQHPDVRGDVRSSRIERRRMANVARGSIRER